MIYISFRNKRIHSSVLSIFFFNHVDPVILLEEKHPIFIFIRCVFSRNSVSVFDSDIGVISFFRAKFSVFFVIFTYFVTLRKCKKYLCVQIVCEIKLTSLNKMSLFSYIGGLSLL